MNAFFIKNLEGGMGVALGCTLTDLDLQFGVAIEPVRNFSGVAVYAWENDYQPDSLTRLTRTSAERLKGLLDEIRRGSAAGNVLVNDIIFLWVGDDPGAIWFALEEMFHDGVPTGRPKYQTFEPTAGIAKLGHPALISAQKGRIGGEIYLNPDAATPAWIFNNRSGRYGRHKSRTFRHLKNAANQFRSFGIELELEV